VITGVLVLILLGVTAADGSGGGHPRRWTPPRLGHGTSATAKSPNGTPLTDGLDPKQAACDLKIRTLDSAALRLTAPVTVNGQRLGAGAVIGHVSLRYSVACHAAWGRVDPMPIVDHPTLGTVDVYTIRPADGAKTAFHIGHLEEAYVDMLLTKTGCVEAAGSINLAAGPVVAATTRCMAAPSLARHD